MTLNMLLQKTLISPSVQLTPHNLKENKDAAHQQSLLHNTAWGHLQKADQTLNLSPSPGRCLMPGTALVSPMYPVPCHPREPLLLLASSCLSFLQTAGSPTGKPEDFMKQEKFPCLMCSSRSQIVLQMSAFCHWLNPHFLLILFHT